MSGDDDFGYTQFVQGHNQQLTSSNIPERYWSTLYFKLKDEVYDAGNMFQMQMIDQGSDADSEGENPQESFSWRVAVISEEGISLNDPNHIYLIDHAWTYRSREARHSLEEVPGLLERMLDLMDITANNKERGELVEEVLRTMWKYNQTYRFGHFSVGSENSMPLWYIMDEFGSRIQHSDDPSFRVVPFFFATRGIAYSVMWPLIGLEEGDEVTRCFVENVSDANVRQAKLIPWQPQDMTHISFKQEEPGMDYFESYSLAETLPSPSYEYPGLPQDRNIKVFVDYQRFVEYLTDPRFELVESVEDADVLWYFNSYKDFLSLSEQHPSCLINQFPSEKIVTVKDLLAIVCRRAATEKSTDPMDPNPKWLPVTFNLQTELPKFVSYFQHREALGLDNHWICKPWNLARSMGMHISNNLNEILRLTESGPKVACKYIENPVLYIREDVGPVKFDVRYMVLLASVSPLKMFVYQVFWLRFANKTYSLDYLDEYEKHYTVMNYGEENLKQVHYDDFIPEFESQNPGYMWSDIENDIFLMIKEVFQAATSLPAPLGIGHSPQSRAIYAVDLMLNWDTKPSGEKYMQPMICEVNFGPDCDRACKYHPFFVNDIFSVLFLNDTEDKHVVPL